MKLNSLMAREDSIARREHILEYTTPCTDENVIDIELPELVHFFQESNFQVVKDIGIDRVVDTQEKCLIENCKLDHNIISCFLNSDLDRQSDSTKGELDRMPSISNGSKSSIGPDCNKDVFKQCGFTMKTVNEKLLLAREVDTNLNPPHLSNFNGHRGEQKFDQILDAICLQNISYSWPNVTIKTGFKVKVPCKEAVLVNSMVLSATEVIDNFNHANEASSKSEVESGSIIHEFDSSITIISRSSSREEEPQNANCKPPLEIGDMPRLEDDISERPTISSQSSIIQLGYIKESSLSAAGPLSGPLSCSGRSYSGSISLRSNCSTASTQSFAFPILSTEWNGSPVRMAKADPKHLRTHQRWRKCLLCCKF